MTVTFSEGLMFRQTRTALRAPMEYSGSKSTWSSAVGDEMSCRAILLLGDLHWGGTGFHQSGLSFQDHVVHNFLQVATGFLEDAQLTVSTGSVLQNIVHVSDFFAA